MRTHFPPKRYASSFLLPIVLSIVALVPYLWHYRLITQSFWFGDEFDLLNQIRQQGFWSWAIKPFSENFVPLFKVLWGGAVYLTNGSYTGMLWLLWLTHALTAYLLALAIVRLGFGTLSAILSVTFFAIPGITIETMTWTMQSSAVLSGTFFLAALNVYSFSDATVGGGARSRSICMIGLVAASALSFARGIVAGPILALMAVAPWTSIYSRIRTRWIVGLSMCIVPVGAVFLIFSQATGSHHDVVESRVGYSLPASFGLWAFAINPICKLLLLDPDWKLVIMFATIKIVIMALPLIFSEERQRRWLLGLAMFEIANCVLLAVGRYGTGLPLAASSRYQYISLLTTAPFVGIVVQMALNRMGGWVWPRRFLATAVVVAVFWHGMHIWEWWLPEWVRTRGVEGRKMISVSGRLPKEYTVPGIPFMSQDECRAVIRHFNLH